MLKRVVSSVMLAGVLLLSAAESPQWQGLNRDGVYPESGLLKAWPEGGPKKLWQADGLGSGYSSPVVLKDRVLVTGNGINDQKKREFLTALDKSGKVLWQTEYGNVTNKSYADVRTTPTCVRGKAYLISGMGEVVRIDVQSGVVEWSVDAAPMMQGRPGSWGYAESPLVDGGKVFFTASGEQGVMLALNTRDGSVAWKADKLPGNAAYISPLLVEHNGIRQIIGGNSKGLFGIDPENGKIAWFFEYTDEILAQAKLKGIYAVTPIFHDGEVFVTGGYNIGGVALKLSSQLNAAKLLWQNFDLDTHHGGVVLVQGRLYGSNWHNNSTGHWVCVDWRSGKTLYEQEWTGKGKGSIAAADGMLYCYDEKRGSVALVKADGKNFSPVGEFTVSYGQGQHWAHPVISDKVLYLRRGGSMAVYSLAAE